MQEVALDEPRGGMCLGDAESVLAAVAAEQGAAFVSHLAGRHSLEPRHVKMIRVEGKSPRRRVMYLVQPRGRERTAAQQCLQELVDSEGQRMIIAQTTFAKER